MDELGPTPQTSEIRQTEVTTGGSHRNVLLVGLIVLVLVIAGAFFSLWFSLWPISDEAVVATYTCSNGLSWNISTGHSVRDTYGEAIAASRCEYHRAELYKERQKMFSIANFTDCRDFNSSTDLMNSIHDSFYAGHQTFPAGAPILAAMIDIDAAAPPLLGPLEFDDIPYELGFQISNRSKLTTEDFFTASRCILNHRSELHDIFGELHFNSGPLMWLALIDESAPHAEDDLPGTGQVFACKNGYTYRTSAESLFALAPGELPFTVEESGFEKINDTQIAIIGINGRLFEPDHTQSGAVMGFPYPDYRLVNPKKLPSPLSECADGRHVSLETFLKSLEMNTVIFEHSPQ